MKIIKFKDLPKKIDNLYIASVLKFENRNLVYNPKGKGGILILDDKSLKVLKSCNGKKSIDSLIKTFGLNNEDAKILFNTLFEKQFISINNNVRIDKTVESGKTLDCWLHITNQCNFKCKYCFVEKSSINMDKKVAFDLVDKMLSSCRKNNWKKLQIRFSGGEPLTRFNFLKEIVEYTNKHCKNIETKFVILSNGTLVNDTVAKYLLKNNIDISISLDGLEKYNDINRYYLNKEGSFDNVIKGMNCLLKNNVIPKIMTVVSEENLGGLEDLTKFLINNKLTFRYSLEKDVYTGKPGILKNQTKLINVLHKCFDLIEEAYISGNLEFGCQFCDVTFSFPKVYNCGAGINSFACRNDGMIAVCGVNLNNPIGNLKEVKDFISFLKNANSPVVCDYASHIQECKNCPWQYSCSNTCPLQNFASFGVYNHKSVYCDIYKEIMPRYIQLKATKMCSKAEHIKGGDKIDNYIR